MKSKSMRFRWLSNLKKWVVNNLCCVVKKKNNKKRQRCENLESGIEDQCGVETSVSAIKLNTIIPADLQSPRHADSETGISKLMLDDLRKVSLLGVGGFGRVILVQEKNNASKTYALKILNKHHIVAMGDQDQVMNEKDIMAGLKSNFIIRLYKTFKDDDHLYFLMETCLGGELWTLINKEKGLSHKAAKFYTACIAEALMFMHSRGIVHRDLKLENVLLDSTGYAKLIDFGVAKKLGPGAKAQTMCGTAHYTAPEMILNKGHDTAADMWSLGVLVFAMLSGSSLFADKEDDDIKTYENILTGIDVVVFPNEIKKTAEDFIRKLCRSSPTKRLYAQEIPKHGWFKKFRWEGLRKKTLKPPFIPKITSPVDTSNFDVDDLPEEAKYPRADNVSSWDSDF